MNLKAIGRSEKATEFFAANYDPVALRSVSELGIPIHIIEIDGRLRVMIEIGEDNTHDDIDDAVPLALRWRDRLLEWQGPYIHGGETHFLMRLDLAKREGKISYSDLAEILNQRVASHLRDYNNLLEICTAHQDELQTISNNGIERFIAGAEFCQKYQVDPSALDHARFILRSLRLRNVEIEEYLSEGLKDLAQGFSPIMRNYPISAKKLESTLRSWRGGKKSQIIEKKAKEYEDSHS